MDERKILIITYYWPPSGGSGVQRWLKFVKYLPQFGYTPYVFTPENPAFDIKDSSLLKDVPAEAEVIHFPIWEPYETFFKIAKVFGSANKSAKPTTLVSKKQNTTFQKLSTWMRGNLFIPDPRVFWVRPAVSFLHDFLTENKITTIITTGPPHSMHLIGYRLKKKNPSLQWLADFRDPWSDWGLLDSLKTGAIARRIHKNLESKVLAFADTVVTITPFYVRKFEALSKRKVSLITNGFDEDDFKAIEYQKPDKFTIRHVGIVNEKCNPRPFMQAVERIMLRDADFRASVTIDFVGEVNPHFIAYVKANASLASVTNFNGNIPHKDLLAIYGSSSVLLLVLYGYKDAEGFLPGKLFEYLATCIPVLGIGPVNGDAANLLHQTNAGNMFEANDIEAIENTLLKHFLEWKKTIPTLLRHTDSSRYTRRSTTEELVKLL